MHCFSTCFCVIYLSSELLINEYIIYCVPLFLVWVIPRPFVNIFVREDCVGDYKTIVVT